LECTIVMFDGLALGYLGNLVVNELPAGPTTKYTPVMDFLIQY